jgi:hypothetical protein
MFVLFTDLNEGICFSADGLKFHSTDDMKADLAPVGPGIEVISMIECQGKKFKDPLGFLKDMLGRQVRTILVGKEDLPAEQRATLSKIQQELGQLPKDLLLVWCDVGAGGSIVFIPKPSLYYEKLTGDDAMFRAIGRVYKTKQGRP